MDLNAGIRSRCHVNTNEEGDRFVGVKADTDDAVVYFPVGYKLPETDEKAKQDVLHLFQVLGEFTENHDRVLAMKKFEAPQSVDFPINAYMEVIHYFLENNGYYMEKDPVYHTRDRGNVNWTRTFRTQKPIIQSNGSPVYTKYTVRESTPNDNKLITYIHKYCVYESFDKLGWLFTPYMPEPAPIDLDIKRFVMVLNDKLATTNNDKDKRLFSSMKSILEYIDEKTSNKQFYFGTDNFQIIWEKLIDRVFGVKNKKDFFPRTKWRLKFGKNKEKYPLEPDTIMIMGDNIYVLDAKYYRYGRTGNPNHLPESTSINKQITYGEYVYNQKHMKDENLYNAFLMPYNAYDNPFGLNDHFVNVGEAIGEWKGDDHQYERIQGILVDVRYLMYNYTGNPRNNIIELSESIERALSENNGLLPNSDM